MTGPAIYSPDNPFAPQATAPVTYSPDNPFAPKPKPLPTLRPLPMTAARDATATAVDQTGPGLEQQMRARTLTGQMEAAPGQVAEIAGEALRHPLRTVAGMAKATVQAPYLTGRYVGQQVIPSILPIAEPVRDVTGKEALAGAAMLAGPAVAPIIGTLPTAALTGAAFMPDQPFAGGLIGAALWGANRLRTGAPVRLVPEQPGPPTTTVTARVAGRALPAGPDYEVTTDAPFSKQVRLAPVPEAPVPSLAAPQAPKLLPRLRRVAPEEPEAPARPVAPPAVPERAPAPSSFLPEEDVSLPAPVVRARTESGRMMSNLGKATPEQLAGEYRALMDAHEQDLGAAQGGVRIFGNLDYAGDPSSGAHLGDVGMVTTPAGMKAWGRIGQRQKSIDKIEAELTKRGIGHADAYWMGGGEEVPTGVGEARPPYGAVTPEQRNRFEAVRWSAARALEIGKQRQAELEKPAGPPDLEPALNREKGVGEQKAPYGKPETLTGVAFRRKDNGGVYSMDGFDGGHSQLFDDLEDSGVPTVDVPNEGRFERATATFDHGFVTSSGRFVDRAEALKIARASHQLENEARAKGFGMSAENIKVGEEPRRYAPDNPFGARAVVAQERAAKLNKPTAHEQGMATSFPLGAGFGRPGAGRRVDASVSRAVEAVKAQKDADYLTAQAEAFDRGEIDAQGRRRTAASDARSEKAAVAKTTRNARVEAAKAVVGDVSHAERWRVPAGTWADAHGYLGGSGRKLIIFEHGEAVRAALAEGKPVPPNVLAESVEEGRVGEDARQLDVFTPEQLDAFDAAPAVDVRAVEKFGSMDEAQRAITLVEKHAGKFATTYKGPAPRMKGRLQKVGLRNTGGSMVDLVGQKISGPRDLAKALYPFRSPLHERFFTIVHGAQGEILAATMDTSGAVNYVTPYGGGKSGMMRFIDEVARRAERVGGAEVTIAHNHPSGLTNQSADDISFWNWMGYQLQQRGIRLRGQLVIDHNEASWNAPGQEEVKLPVPAGGPDWVDVSAEKLSSPEALAAYVGPGANNGGLHVVYVNAQMQVIALEPHNPSALATIGTWLPAQARGMGAAGVMLVGPKDAVLDIVHAAGNANLSIPVHDIVSAEPQADGSVRFVSEAERGRLYGRNFQGAKRTDAEEAGKFRRLSEAADPEYGPSGGRAGAGEAGALQPLHGVGERGPEYKKARAAGIASGLTPEQADAYAAAAKDIDFDGAKAVAQAKLEAGGLRTRLRRWADAAADQTRAIDRLGRAAVERGMPAEKAPEYELALSYNSDDTIRRALYNAPEMATTHGVLDPITREPIGPTLESVVEPLGKDPEKVRQAFTYVVALRKAGRGLKATAGDPNELQAALDAVQALSQVPLYRKFAADLEAHLNAIGRYAVRSGLWTEAQWEQLKHSDLFYVPFRRLMTHIEPPAAKTTYGVKRANLSAGIETFEGSRRFLANPVEAVAGYDARIIKRADAYRVGSAVIDALSQYMGEEGKAILTPIAANDPAVKAFAAAAVRRNLARSGLNVAEVGMVADLSAPQIDPHNPVIWRNRKGGMAPPPAAQTDAFGEETPPELADREYYLLNDPELYKALVATRADSPLGNGALMAAFRIARRLMTVTTTGINPRFALGLNIARDVPQAIMQVPGIRPDDIAAATLEAAKAVVGSSEFADILARHGLGSASIYAHDINPEAAARRIAPVTKLQAIGAKVRKIGGWPLETAERVGAASDLVARLAAARAVRRNALKTGSTPRGAIARAATTGVRATVNFNRRAGIPVLQFLEQSVPFFGAAMRSGLRATEAVGEVPYRVLGALGVVGLAVLAEWAMTKNDKEKRAQQVDRLPSERSRFVQFGKYRWPLSQEMAVVAAGMRYGLGQFTRDDPDGAEQLVQAIYNLLPPVASDLVQGDVIAPWPGWREVQEVAQNRQAYGNRPIIPERLADLPPALRRQESTSPTFDLMAALARKGAIIVPPLAETSPLAVEHVVRGFLANMTPLLTMVTDAALARTEAGKRMNIPVPAPLTAHPLNPASAFVVREPPTRTSSESWFYQRAREYAQGELAERVVGKMEDLAETPAGQARAATARRLGGGTAWGLSEELSADVGLIIKEAQLTLKDYRESETDIRQQVNDGALAPQAARALLDSLTLERQHMLRETRNALQRLGVPKGTRSSTGTRGVSPIKTPPKAPYSSENPFKP